MNIFRKISKMQEDIVWLEYENKKIEQKLNELETERLLKRLKKLFKVNVTIELDWCRGKMLAINNEKIKSINGNTCTYLESKECEREIEAYLYRKNNNKQESDKT